MEQDHGLVIFETNNGKTRLEISLINDTLWLSQQQIADLFDTDRTSVNRHIQNIYQTSELSENSTCADFAQVRQEGSRTVKRNIPFYNLDVIISVGYRVNSKKGTQFRIWASQILKDYLVKGYSVNEQKLQEQSKNIEELKSTLVLLEKTVSRQAGNIEQARDIAKVLVDFSQGLRILDDYDHGRLDAHGFHDRKAEVIDYTEFMKVVEGMKTTFESDLFGKEKDQSFRSSCAQIYQTFNGHDLYPSLEEKAAMLLYFVVKNHSFVDGNKRIGAVVFLYFLNKNHILYSDKGAIIDNQSLAALTLLIAESDPMEKELVKKITVSLLNRGK